MSEQSIFAYNDNVRIVSEINNQKDVNYLRSFIRAGRLSDTDAAILRAVSLGVYVNRRNIERYLSVQKDYVIREKANYRYNISKLLDAGFLCRLYAAYDDEGKEGPRIYCLSNSACQLLPQVFGNRKAVFRSRMQSDSPCDVLAAEAAFQCYCSMLADPVYAGTVLKVKDQVALPSHTALVSVSSCGSAGTLYGFAVRRLDSSRQRAFFDAQALLSKLAADGTRGAFLFICEDVLHMEQVAASVPSSLAESGGVLYTYDLSLVEENNRVILYTADSELGRTALNRVELSPLSSSAAVSSTSYNTEVNF